MYSVALCSASVARRGCSSRASSTNFSSSSVRALRNSRAALRFCRAGSDSGRSPCRVIGETMRFLMRPSKDSFSYMKPSDAITGHTNSMRETGQQRSGSSSSSLSSLACRLLPSTRPWLTGARAMTAATVASSMPSRGAIAATAMPWSASAVMAFARRSSSVDGPGGAIGTGGWPGGGAPPPDADAKGHRGASGSRAAMSESVAILEGTDIASASVGIQPRVSISMAFPASPSQCSSAAVER
mmetsp:Transcript_2110/g.7051  ORF Transcript_2110/g.7051 Transcript_2110/m.7051 type:complete len:242 (+) Transcript_2110:280-1005(+)